MRTILAVDEMLAAAVRRKLDGESVVIDRMRMRDLGRKAGPRLREIATERPCVLVIGGRAWDALPMLRRLRLPREVPVVLLTPEATWETKAEAYRMGVVSIVPLDEGTDTRAVVATEIQIAWSLFSSPRTKPVLIRRSRRPARDLRPASPTRIG